MAKQCVGIDIGSEHAKLAVFDGQRVTQAVLCEIPDGLVRDGRITSFEAMSDVIKAAVKENKISVKDCAIALHPADVLMRRVTMPAMTVSQLELNLPYEFRDYIAEGKGRYNFDYAVLNMSCDESGTPREMDLLAAAAEKETVESYSSMLRRAGLRVEADYQGRSLKSQLKQANRAGARAVVMLGPDELAAGCVTLRDMGTHEQESVPRDRLAERVAEVLA